MYVHSELQSASFIVELRPSRVDRIDKRFLGFVQVGGTRCLELLDQTDGAWSRRLAVIYSDSRSLSWTTDRAMISMAREDM
jgi:hypothetical protein